MSGAIRIAGARVVSPGAGGLRVLPDTDVLVEGGRIAAVGQSTSSRTGVRELVARGRVLMPAFVDCHTHACSAGDRLDEWEMKRRGVKYLDILKAGGGIMSTVRAVREASEDELAAALLDRLNVMLREGTTTAEVKSGYGLSTRDELKMLRAIARAAKAWSGTLVPTALLGHAIDPGFPGGPEAFIEHTIADTLPAVSREFPGIAIDAYCEEGAWPAGACVRLFERAKELGHPIRVHTDQFNCLGMVEEATRLGAVSVDHLEASDAGTLERLAASSTAAVLLPCAGFHTDGRYARGRTLADALKGSPDRLAIATNCNPGSAPCSSMPMAVALAVRGCGLSPAEAVHAATAGGARVLGFSDRGRIEPGMRADLILLRHRDERMLAYEFGGNPVDMVICGGEVVA